MPLPGLGAMGVTRVAGDEDARGSACRFLFGREGGYLVRLYVELDQLKADERVANRKITLDRLIEQAKRILKSYTLEVKECAWWSVYRSPLDVCNEVRQSATCEAPGFG